MRTWRQSRTGAEIPKPPSLPATSPATQTGKSPTTRTSLLARLRVAVPSAVSRYGRDRCAQHAAAISYRVLFSIVPLFIFVASVLGLVLNDPNTRSDLIGWLLDRFPLTPEAGADLERILASVPTPASGAGLLGLVALAWSAGGMMASLRIALTDVFERGRDRPFAQSKLVDAALVLSVTLLLLAGFAVSIAVHTVENWSPRVSDWLNAISLDEWGVVANVTPLLLAFPAFLLLYRFVPATRPRFREVWVGALLAAFGVSLVNLGFAYYLATIATWDLLYGSLGSILAFLLVVYLSAGILLLGAELAAAWRASDVPVAAAGEPLPLGKRFWRYVRGLFVSS
jgi:membrane protein